MVENEGCCKRALTMWHCRTTTKKRRWKSGRCGRYDLEAEGARSFIALPSYGSL